MLSVYKMVKLKNISLNQDYVTKKIVVDTELIIRGSEKILKEKL